MIVPKPCRRMSLTASCMQIKAARTLRLRQDCASSKSASATPLPPLVAAHCEEEDVAPLLAAVEAAVRVTQDTDEAVAMGLAFARVLHAVVRSGESSAAAAQSAVVDCVEALRDEGRAQPNPLDDELSDHLEEMLELVDTPLLLAGTRLGLS